MATHRPLIIAAGDVKQLPTGDTIPGNAVLYGTSAATAAEGSALASKSDTGHTHSYQPLDADLTVIAALAPTDGALIQRISGVWDSQTTAQVKASLSITAGDVGLGNVNNTSDANKPVSTATQTALDGKQPLDTDLTTVASLTATTNNVIQSVGSAWASRTPAQLKTSLSLVKADVGLGSVDNTADTAKPVSTATQTALDGKQALDADLTTLAGLTATTDNMIQSVGSAWASRTPTQVKIALVLNNVNNTADADKPTSSATQTALDAKQGTSEKGAASGYASLDSGTKVPIGQIPTGSSATTVAIGNDSRLSDSRPPSGTAGGALNGTYPNPGLNLVPWPPVALTDAATIATDATLSNTFDVTLGGNRILGNPTGAVNGQRLMFRIRQDATGGRVPTLDTKFRFGTDLTSVIWSTAPNELDRLGVEYVAADDKFDVIAFGPGY